MPMTDTSAWPGEDIAHVSERLKYIVKSIGLRINPRKQLLDIIESTRGILDRI
jgi:hypothetical protein